MHKALKLKRVADALAAAGGGWLPLTLKAWRKYVRRKRGKENARPALVAKPVVALPPPPPVAEPPVLDTCAKLQPPSPPLCQTYAAPPVPPPRRRPLRGALREEAVQLAALLERRRAASATYLLEQHQSSKTRRRLTSRPKPIQSKRFGWLKTQGARSPADKTAQQALKVFPALRCLEVASGPASASKSRRRRGGGVASMAWSRIARHRRDRVPRAGVASNLFDRFATAVLVVEFYLTDDLPRVMEPPVAVDP
jgi:hypothetical protein